MSKRTFKKIPQKWRNAKWLQAKHLFKFVGRWKMTKHTFDKCEKAIGSLVKSSFVSIPKHWESLFSQAVLDPNVLRNADGSLNMLACSLAFPSQAPYKSDIYMSVLLKWLYNKDGSRNEENFSKWKANVESTSQWDLEGYRDLSEVSSTEGGYLLPLLESIPDLDPNRLLHPDTDAAVKPVAVKYDWEALRASIIAEGGIRNKTMMARLPGPYESTATVMSGTSPGIYPVLDRNYLRANNAKSLYYQNSKRDGEKTDEQNQSNQTPGPEQGSPTGTQGNDSGSSQEDRQS